MYGPCIGDVDPLLFPTQHNSTRRRLLLASKLPRPHIVVFLNKMDSQPSWSDRRHANNDALLASYYMWIRVSTSRALWAYVILNGLLLEVYSPNQRIVESAEFLWKSVILLVTNCHIELSGHYLAVTFYRFPCLISWSLAGHGGRHGTGWPGWAGGWPKLIRYNAKRNL